MPYLSNLSSLFSGQVKHFSSSYSKLNCKKTIQILFFLFLPENICYWEPIIYVFVMKSEKYQSLFWQVSFDYLLVHVQYINSDISTVLLNKRFHKFSMNVSLMSQKGNWILLCLIKKKKKKKKKKQKKKKKKKQKKKQAQNNDNILNEFVSYFFKILRLQNYFLWNWKLLAIFYLPYHRL